MPIQKSKILANGVSGDYWRIRKIEVDTDTLNTTFRIWLYLNKSASDTNKAPLAKNKTYSFIFTQEELLSGNLIGLGETKILDKANTMVDPIFPSLGSGPVPFDLDLNDGEIVE